MACEYAKDGEKPAKEWYGKLAQEYTRYPQAAKAAGALKRLESDGQPLDISGTNLATGQPFSTASLKGKAVVVYYWASWSQSLPEDVRKLNSLVKEYGAKGLEVVTVNLDHDAEVAAQTVDGPEDPRHAPVRPRRARRQPAGRQLRHPGRPALFVAGKDGKIVNRSAQAATVEDDVKKLLP